MNFRGIGSTEPALFSGSLFITIQRRVSVEEQTATELKRRDLVNLPKFDKMNPNLLASWLLRAGRFLVEMRSSMSSPQPLCFVMIISHEEIS